MLTEDYIMRMINQALSVLLIALGFKRNGQFKEALQTFDQALENLLGLNAHLVKQLDDNTVLEMLTFLGKLDIDRLLILADIYREEAEVYALQEQVESWHFAAQRSLRFFLEVVLASDVDPNLELIQKIEPMRIKLDPSSLPVETRLALMDYLDRLISTSDDFLASTGLTRKDLQDAYSVINSTYLL
jgi:hypothetical protein